MKLNPKLYIFKWVHFHSSKKSESNDFKGEVKSTTLGNWLANRFEWLYYKFSPDVARIMVKNPFFKHTIQWLIVTPIAYFLIGIFKPVDSIRENLARK